MICMPLESNNNSRSPHSLDGIVLIVLGGLSSTTISFIVIKFAAIFDATNAVTICALSIIIMAELCT